jgi:hypothetical protein
MPLACKKATLLLTFYKKAIFTMTINESIRNNRKNKDPIRRVNNSDYAPPNKLAKHESLDRSSLNDRA